MTPPPGALAEIDLDASPLPRPRRGPLPVAAALAAALAGVAGAVLRVAVDEPPAPPAQAVTAWASVTAWTPGPGDADPVADLLVTVANRGETEVTVTGARTDGPRVGPGSTGPGGRPLAAGDTVDLAVRVPLACSDRYPPGLRGSGVDVEVDVAGGAPVRAAPVGALAVTDGVCRAALAGLPDAWSTRVDVVDAGFDGPTATLVLDGIAPGTRVVGVYAPVDLLPVRRVVADPDRPGRLTLALGLPAVSCPYQGPRVPFGVQVRLQDDDALRTRYAHVGPALAGWLLAGRRGPAAPGTDRCTRSP